MLLHLTAINISRPYMLKPNQCQAVDFSTVGFVIINRYYVLRKVYGINGKNMSRFFFCKIGAKL
jgi:hypothetical protein